MNLWEIEHARFAEGYTRVCGTDEAGAGPLAGPVYAAAVILPPDYAPQGLNDSKKVTEKRREALYDEILSHAVAWSVVSIDGAEIDRINILEARLLAMRRAVDALSPPADFVLIDGNLDKGFTLPHLAVVNGDAKSASIAAASILAKVCRDRHMLEMAAQYPEYAFEKHKGYGTKLHYERLREYGPCPIHRRTFLKNL